MAVLPSSTFADDATRPGHAHLAARLVRWAFIAVSLTFLAALLLAPLATVFVRRSPRASPPTSTASRDPDTRPRSA